MLKRMFAWWYRFNKWTIVNALDDVPHSQELKRYVIIGAPHTSNWDFVYGMGALSILGLPAKFTIKKEWMVFPFKRFLYGLGAIPIDRAAKPDGTSQSMVSVMAQLLVDATEDLMIVVTPEGTRSRRDKWKKGFYFVAKEAGVPILLAYINYDKKECGISRVFYPSDDVEADMRAIMAFYKTTRPKHPTLFSVDKNYD